MGEPEERGRVHAKNGIEVGGSHLSQGPKATSGRVTDDDVQSAEVLPNDIDHRLHVVTLRHIGSDRDRPPTAILDRIHNFFGCISRVQKVHNYGSPACSQ